MRGREEGQLPQGEGQILSPEEWGSQGRGAAGEVRPVTPGPDVGAGPHLERGRAAAAAAQVAEPGGGDASSPSPGPAAGRGEHST